MELSGGGSDVPRIQEATKFNVGLDIHSKRISLCVLSETGQVFRRAQVRTGTGLENSAGFERESGATGASRGVSGVLGAFVSVARHAVKCAEELRTDVVA